MTQIKAWWFFLGLHRKQSMSPRVQDKVSNEGIKQSKIQAQNNMSR